MESYSSMMGPGSIGPFRIVRVLGTGGNGTVYLGERMEQFSQRVAIKVVGDRVFAEEAAAATEREERILASLDHEDIVRLLDQGVSERGERYLVMEYVDGLPIDAFCDAKRLTVEARLRLMLPVMEAVIHAHRHLVVHGDLKPANILVTPEGLAKVLDFGIATMVGAQGATNTGAHTPEFASPEQVAGERVGIASDVYSLGLIAALLATGRGLRQASPIVKPEVAAARSTTPAGLARVLRGDLDAVLQKALREEPEERYATVEAFQQDVQRYLEGRPVAARPASVVERMRKWAGRNTFLAVAATVLVCALALSSAGVVWQSAHAARERRVAQDRLHELIRLTGVLEGELYGSVAPLAGSEEARGFLTKTATETLDRLAVSNGEDAVLVVELTRQYDTLAHVEVSAGGTDKGARARAIRDLDRGLELLRGLPAGQGGDSAGLVVEMEGFRRTLGG